VSNKVLSFLFLILSVSSMKAQNTQRSYESADSAWYDQLLYSGVEWRPTMQMVAGHEFFLTSAFLYGTILIDGITFKEVRMKYDICNDDIIVLWKNSAPIIIDSKKVDEFTVVHNGVTRRFVNFQGMFPEIRGFAEVMYQGKSGVVASHTKAISKNPAGINYEEFREDTRYYFILNGSCFQIKSRASFLDHMGEYEIPVRKFIRQKNIFVSLTSPEGFVIAAAYFDSLTGKKQSE
jgi:hypothetical protein